MKFLTKKLQIIIFLTLSFFSYNIFAASDGNPGASSEGKMDISIIFDSVVRISGLQDISFNNIEPASIGFNDTNFENVYFCVFGNSENGLYNVTIAGENDSGEKFNTKLVGGTELLPYQLDWYEVTNPSPVTSGSTIAFNLQSNVSAPASFFNQKSVNSIEILECNASNDKKNGRLRIKFIGSDMNNATPGTYQDILTITVSPAS